MRTLIKMLLEDTKINPSNDFFDLSFHDQYRTLVNVRPPKKADDELLLLQDEYLQSLAIKKGIIEVNDLSYYHGIALWQGDITRLNSDAIVNAGNKVLLGCFVPLHNCIDNIIHTYAGMQVRYDCNEIMKGKYLSTGGLVVTDAYNLPSKYIFHTVGPIVDEISPSIKHQRELMSCYVNALDKAKEMNLESIAFCCISTGVYGYPRASACALAMRTVKDWLKRNGGLRVVFDTFLPADKKCYETELINKLL